MNAPRRWAYSLRTLLVLFTSCACWLGWNANLVHKRKQLFNLAQQHDCAICPREPLFDKLYALRSVGANEGNFAELYGLPDVSWIRRLMGDESIAIFEFYQPQRDYGAELLSMEESPPLSAAEYYPLPGELKAQLRESFPEALFDYAAPRMSSARSFYTEEAADDPERFSFPTIGPLARRP